MRVSFVIACVMLGVAIAEAVQLPVDPIPAARFEAPRAIG